MKQYTAIIERCPDTKLFVGYIPGFAGAHSQAETLDELNRNLKEVVEMLLEDGKHPGSQGKGCHKNSFGARIRRSPTARFA